MKKVLSVLCLLLAAALLCPLTAVAAQAQPAGAADVYAVVSMSGGELVVEDAPDAALMEDADSYALYVEDEPVLTVEHLLTGTREAAPAPQFYSVNFTFAGTQTEVFLTGLTAQSVDAVQQLIIANYADGENFEMTDLGFIDTEKTYNEDEDDELCWAASCSDMLVYTGWAAKAGFDSEDDVFEAYIDGFENGGGHAIYGLGWFFNGVRLNTNGAAVSGYPDSGGYLKDYAFERYVQNGVFTVNKMDEIAALLRDGCAVGLGAYLYFDGEEDGGHAVTLWGYVLDRSVSPDDPARYRAVFITDSDSHELPDVDRREAQNVMSLHALSVYEDYYLFDFDEHQTALVYDYTALKPYGDTTDHEDDPDVPRDKINYPDLSVLNLYLSNTNNARERGVRFESGSTVYFSCRFVNYADQVYAAPFDIRTTITAADGTVVYDYSTRYGVTLSVRGEVTMPFLSQEGLEAGDYTLTVTLNEDPNASGVLPEGYYYNNTMRADFSVRDSYLLGDVDDNGKVDILDATKIQRFLAGFGTRLDDNAVQRGDINGNGLNIIDATLVQRYLADLTVSHPVGGKQLYR